MRIEHMIEKGYRGDWHLFEGVREILQNAKDAETEFHAKMTVDHYNGDTLRIENEGVTLGKEVLLLGKTSKTDRKDMIGSFGEGLKIGLLALCRDGYQVKIRNGGEIWEPSIQKSEKYNAEVLVFDIKGGNKPENRVRIEIKGIDKDQWAEMQTKFLFLTAPKVLGDTIKTSHGRLLLNPLYAGKVFVKGIFVEHEPLLSYGYDLLNAAVDVDRKLVKRFDLRWETRGIWSEAVHTRPDLLGVFFTLLEESKDDVAGLEHSAAYLPEAAKLFISEKFLKQHGQDAVPVKTLADSREIDHLGKTGIIVPPALAAVLETKHGSAETVKAQLKTEVLKAHSWSELTDKEKANFDDAFELLHKVRPIKMEDIGICTFRSENMEGMFRDGKLMISKTKLESRRSVLLILVHEYAHNLGGDGTADHNHEMQEIWADLLTVTCGF